MPGARHRHPSCVREAAAEVAAFVGARPEDVAFVDNATTGVNAVLRSLRFLPGDEVLVTDHGYGAVANAARLLAGQQGAAVVTVPVPYPRFAPAAFVAAVTKAISARTRLAIFDHVTSESALIMPVADLVAACKARGVRVLVDGAPAPGVLALDLPALGADWYAANLHKWACAPRSCGFLWASEAGQIDLHPPVISWGLGQGFAAEFDWVGTRDVSAWLAAPAGIAYLTARGLDEVWTHNHGLAWTGAALLCDTWGSELPADKSAIGFMATVPVPESIGSEASDAIRLRDSLLYEHEIEVQVHAGHGRVWVRISTHLYNELDDIARLSRAVLALAR
jgi:isopenicillin-N epimerase